MRKFTNNDYVRIIDSNLVGMVVDICHKNNDHLVVTMDESEADYYKEDELEPWSPKYDDWCMFWNDGQKSYRIARFNQIAWGRGREGKYKDQQQNYFTHAIPYLGVLPK